MNNKVTIELPRPRGLSEWAMLIMIVKTILSLSVVIPYNDYIDLTLTVVAVALFIIDILSQGYTVKTLLLCGVVVLVALYSCVTIGNSALLVTMITCLAIRNRDIDREVELIYRYELLFFILHTILAILMWMIGNSEIYVVGAAGIRFHLGFGNRNRLAIYLFNLVIMWIYLHFDNIKWKNILVILLLGGGVYALTATRTNFVEIAITVILLSLFKVLPKMTKNIVSTLCKFLFPMLFVITIILVQAYSKQNPIAMAIDTLLSSRIRLGAYAYIRDGFTLFGQRVSYTAVWDEVYRLSTFTFDNIYTYFAMNQGIIWMILLSICFFLMSSSDDDKGKFAIIVWMLYGMTEVHGLNCYMCFPLLIVTQLLKNEKWRSNSIQERRNT